MTRKAEAYRVAVEHVAWLIAHDHTTADAYAAINRPYSSGGWSDVIAAYAGVWPRLAHG